MSKAKAESFLDLIESVKTKDYDQAGGYVHHGFDYTATNDQGRSAIDLAIEAGAVDLVKSMLNHRLMSPDKMFEDKDLSGLDFQFLVVHAKKAASCQNPDLSNRILQCIFAFCTRFHPQSFKQVSPYLNALIHSQDALAMLNKQTKTAGKTILQLQVFLSDMKIVLQNNVMHFGTRLENLQRVLGELEEQSKMVESKSYEATPAIKKPRKNLLSRIKDWFFGLSSTAYVSLAKNAPQLLEAFNRNKADAENNSESSNHLMAKSIIEYIESTEEKDDAKKEQLNFNQPKPKGEQPSKLTLKVPKALSQLARQKNAKELVINYIDHLDNSDIKSSLIERSCDKQSPLFQFFATQRGILPTRLHAGSFEKLSKIRAQIEENNDRTKSIPSQM